MEALTCPNCGNPLTDNDITTELDQVAGKLYINVDVVCEICQTKYYTIVNTEDLLVDE